MDNKSVTIPKRISGGEDLVVVRRRDFEVFARWREEVRDTLAKVNRGRKEFRARKTRVQNSPRELI